MALLERVAREHADAESCVQAMKCSALFSKCDPAELAYLASQAEPVAYREGDVIIEQGQPHDDMYLVAAGRVERLRQHEFGPERQNRMEVGGSGYTIGAHYALKRVPAYATAVCNTDVRVFKIKSEVLRAFMIKKPAFAVDMVHSLNSEVRDTVAAIWGMGSTPLLEHKAQKGKNQMFAPAVAASVESFYRSALQGFLITRLQPGTPLVLFPNMGVQVPTRVVYITGLKQVRVAIEENVDFGAFTHPDAARVGAACAPGIIMTPVSSVLEACNVPSSEPLWRRWVHGGAARCVREIVFAVGINQLSDFCEERVPPGMSDNSVVRNAVGSMVAGITAGYLSHVPHNLSTLKLMEPARSYRDIFRE